MPAGNNPIGRLKLSCFVILVIMAYKDRSKYKNTIVVHEFKICCSSAVGSPVCLCRAISFLVLFPPKAQFTKRRNARLSTSRANHASRWEGWPSTRALAQTFQWRQIGDRATAAQNRVLHLKLSDVWFLKPDPRTGANSSIHHYGDLFAQPSCEVCAAATACSYAPVCTRA